MFSYILKKEIPKYRHSYSLHCTVLHCTSLHCISMHFTVYIIFSKYLEAFCGWTWLVRTISYCLWEILSCGLKRKPKPYSYSLYPIHCTALHYTALYFSPLNCFMSFFLKLLRLAEAYPDYLRHFFLYIPVLCQFFWKLCTLALA